ncbi:hypothetical protein Leryth_013061 [Lithospermum erythrorhizon]|nr:hypothetical protein Leryth_013061 [Lithospermum erythrorhizon]
MDLIECEKDKKENQGSDDCEVDEGNGSDPVSESIHKPNNEPCILEVRSGSFSPDMELKGNEEFSVVLEAIDCSLHVDASAELSRHAQSVGEQNTSVEIMQELQCKERELEKLIMSSDFVDASPFVGACEEIEEGELSRDMEVDDISVDLLSEYDILPPVEKANELQAFKYSSAHHIGQSEIEKKKGHSSSLLDAMTSENGIIMEVDGKRNGEMNGSFLLEISGVKEQSGEMKWPGHPTVASNCLDPAGNMKPENVADNQTSAAAEKDGDAPKKKRTPLTKERRAKKKKKKGLKRAEKNRVLGVKRLKIQPMVKPKAVSYCRHYLKGRCQEGEKCKFSHDTVPLTKSTACCHFARHSCMKGEDCPFDHQLSKYPCNNIASKGFCSRGADCLFSHEIPAKDARSAVSYSSVCEMKMPSGFNSPTPKKTEKQEHTCGTTSQKVEAKSCASDLSNVRSNGQHSAAPVKIHSMHPPKGVNVLVHGNMSSVQMHKQLDSQISKTDSGDNKVLPMAHNNQKANEVDMPAAKTPRGINFLSFGKSPMTGSNGKVISYSLPNRDFRTGKSAVSTPTPNVDGALVSFGNSSNNCIPGGQLNPHHSDGKSVSTSFRGGESTSEKSHIPTPFKATSSPFPSKSAVESEVGTASSSKSPFLSETLPLVHKALHSTLAFAANVEPQVKLDSSKTSSFGNKSSGSLQSNQPKASTVLDFLYGTNSNLKT